MAGTDKKASLQFLFFADLVVLARSLNPFPYRTRPLNSSAPMVLSLKAWKSRSLPGLPKTENLLDTMIDIQKPAAGKPTAGFLFCAASIDPPLGPVGALRIDVQIHLF